MLTDRGRKALEEERAKRYIELRKRRESRRLVSFRLTWRDAGQLRCMALIVVGVIALFVLSAGGWLNPL
jgi:hypothetical protein